MAQKKFPKNNNFEVIQVDMFYGEPYFVYREEDEDTLSDVLLNIFKGGISCRMKLYLSPVINNLGRDSYICDDVRISSANRVGDSILFSGNCFVLEKGTRKEFGLWCHSNGSVVLKFKK